MYITTSYNYNSHNVVSVCFNSDMKYLLFLVLAIALTVEANPIIGILSDLPLANGGLLGLGALGGNRSPLGRLEKIPERVVALGQKIPEAILGLGAKHGLNNDNPISGISSGIQQGKKELDDLNLKF